MLRKVAIIGSQGLTSHDDHRRLECYPWHDVARISNLSDFHVVIINLLSLPLAKKVDWTAFSRVLSLSSVGEILGSGGLIVVMGDPRIEMTLPRVSGSGNHQGSFLEQWSGVNCDWDERPGQTRKIDFADDLDSRRYRRYLETFDSWTYSLKEAKPRPDELVRAFGLDSGLAANRELRLNIHVDPFCVSRYGTMLAGALRPRVERRYGVDDFGRPMFQVVHEMGSIVLLPPTRSGESESIELILLDLCEIEIHRGEPPWAAEMIAPGQEAIDVQAQAIEEEIERKCEVLDAKQAERTAARLALRLLYEQHAGLEVVVRDTLRELGADVEDPEDPTKEDGWVTVQVGGQIFEAVLEVKGTEKNAFDERGLRQLAEWVSRGIERRHKTYKGIFVGNASVAVPPVDRTNPFGANFATNASLRGYAAIKSEDLYAAYCLKKLGRLDVERFWRDLFQTNGIVDSAPYHAVLLDAG